MLAIPVVKALLSPYGRIVDIYSGSTKVANRNFKSGVKVVKMEVGEVEKNKIPHLFKFQCGNKALVTIQGRPPLCLKCLQVGHYRNSCNGQTDMSEVYYKIQKSFSDAAKSSEVENTLSEENNAKEAETSTLETTTPENPDPETSTLEHRINKY